MTFRSFRAVAAVSLAVALSPFLLADDAPWDGVPFSADPAKILEAASRIPADKDDGVVVLLDEARYTFDAEGRMQRTEYLVYRVTDDAAAEDWSSIEVPWSPWYSERPVADARVITKDGSVHRLDPKSFGTEDVPDEPSMFTDTRLLQGPLPAVAAGSVVEQTIVWREKNQIEGAGVSHSHEFGRWVATQRSRAVIEYPASLAVKVANHTNPTIEPVRSEQDGRIRLVYETGALPALEVTEWNVPAEISTRSFIALSTGRSWGDLARRYAELVDRQIGTESLARQMPAIGRAKSPREIAAVILAKVEHGIRYAGVEFGEGSIIPRTPRETLAHKYGDCKDKATLLVAMLRQAGVPAHVALLVAGSGPDVDPELPGLGLFNHVIVAAGPETDRLWIDPTDEFARAGELPMQDQGRWLLIASPETTALTMSPTDEASANSIVDSREFFLAEVGKSRVLHTSEYRGQWERNTRRRYADSNAEAIRKGLESYATGNYAAKALGKFSTSDPHDLTSPFTIRMEVLDAARGTTAGGEAAVGVFLTQLLADVPWDLHPHDGEEKAKTPRKTRVQDYLLSNPHVRELRYRIHPPVGYTLRTPPMNETLNLGPMTVTKELAVENDGTVTASFRLNTGPRRMTAAQYEEARAAVGKLEKEPALLITFDQVGQKYLDSGEIGKAIEEFRRWTAAHPKEASHHVDMARALLAAGLGDEARREARKAVEIEPKSSRAHFMLARMLIHDAIGREMKKGCDVPQALIEYRKAKELDPSDVLVRAELASVLRYNDRGLQYGSGAPLLEAIAEYEAMKTEVEANNAAIDRELMELYVRTEQWAKLKTLTETTTDTESKDTHHLMAIAMLEGAPAALDAAHSLDASKRRTTIAQVGGMLAVRRYYPVAADLVEAAAQGAPNAAVLRQQVSILRKARRIDHYDADPNEPRDLLVQMFLALRSKDTIAAMRPLLTVESSTTFDDDDDKEDASSLEEKDENFAAFSSDAAIAAFEVQQDGDEKSGFRLRGRVASETTGLTAYVVRENGAWRIAAMSFGPPMLALRALRLAQAGDLEGASRWLDWAREIVEGGDEDPVASNAFAALWTRGKAADAATIELAAATLLPSSKKAAEIALPILQAAQAGAPDETKWRIDQAMADAYRITENWSAFLDTADRLAARYPDSVAAFEWGVNALHHLDRDDEIHERATARLQRLSNDPSALRALARLATRRGQHEVAQAYRSQLLSSAAEPTAGDYNEQAWSALFAGTSLTEATEQARRAVAIAPTNYPSLNTLAVLYAEQNSSAEARELLLKSLAASKDEMETQDWYVVGRIAENYGLREPAIEAYRKVQRPDDIESSTWQLAQKRLAELSPDSAKRGKKKR